MIGVPRQLNSKYDYIYVRENFPESVWQPLWQGLLQNHKVWVDVGVIKEGERAIIDDTHRSETIIEIDEHEGEASRVHQYELRENPASDMIRLGFTEEEVKEALQKQ